MNTNNENGKLLSVTIGIYFIVKAVLNLILGGGFMDIIWAVLEAAALYTGIMYLNYVVAVIVAIIAIKCLPNNISHFASNFIYLIEGIIDILCCIALCAFGSIREHFTNTPSTLFGDNDDDDDEE